MGGMNARCAPEQGHPPLHGGTFQYNTFRQQHQVQQQQHNNHAELVRSSGHRGRWQLGHDSPDLEPASGPKGSVLQWLPAAVTMEMGIMRIIHQASVLQQVLLR
ncbi:unnamed protein product [Calypogeia fissa]